VAKLGLDNGRLSRHSAMAVIAAIEAFAPNRSIRGFRADPVAKGTDRHA
jgi:hypothetical protein